MKIQQKLLFAFVNQSLSQLVRYQLERQYRWCVSHTDTFIANEDEIMLDINDQAISSILKQVDNIRREVAASNSSHLLSILNQILQQACELFSEIQLPESVMENPVNKHGSGFFTFAKARDQQTTKVMECLMQIASAPQVDITFLQDNLNKFVSRSIQQRDETIRIQQRMSQEKIDEALKFASIF